PDARALGADGRLSAQLLFPALPGRAGAMQATRKSMAVFPRSFGALTNPHADIIQRALAVFDELTVALLINPDKQPLFTVEERVVIIRETYHDDARVKVDTFSGLLVDYAEGVGATAIVRGLRAISDFEY